MADERKNAKLTIEVLQSQLGSLSERLGGLEQVKEQQEGTIRVQQQEQSTASSQIKVREGTCRWEREGGRECGCEGGRRMKGGREEEQIHVHVDHVWTN